MGILESGGGGYGVLLAELRQDWATVRHLIDEALKVAELKQTEQRPEVAQALVNSVALSLHHVYSALEASFERVARYLDRLVPHGSDWHDELLRQMALEIPNVRPALLSTRLKASLDEYRRFRHVVRKGYEHALEWDRMAHLVRELPQLRDDLEQAFRQFETYLSSMIEALSEEGPGSAGG
ncbi:MAG: hypothetical protein AB1609_14545 [Bacillota bacterium]